VDLTGVSVNHLHAKSPWRDLGDLQGHQEADKPAWWLAVKTPHFKPAAAAALAVGISWRPRFRKVKVGCVLAHKGRKGVTPHRYVSWVILEDESGERVAHVNTHAVRPTGVIPLKVWREARWQEHLTVLRNVVGQLRALGLPVILTGDFNRRRELVQIPDLRHVAPPTRIKRSKKVPAIDHILVSEEFHVVGEPQSLRPRESDHDPVRVHLTTTPVKPAPKPEPPEDVVSNYARADKTTAWYQDNYPGATMDPNCGVLHTTEGTTLPGYAGGATAPNYTAVPDFQHKRLKWFAHFPDERSARALRNLRGGIETNTANAVQVELVGTCDPATHKRWGKTPHIYWPEAPDWALRDLAHFVADMHRRHDIPIQGPADVWTPYPESYGAGGQRFTHARWRAFYGWCGHQHVPENVHGDPGALHWGEVAKRAKALLEPDPHDDVLPNRVENANTAIRAAIQHAILTVPVNRLAVHKGYEKLLQILDDEIPAS
jgi:hypothetical protein